MDHHPNNPDQYIQYTLGIYLKGLELEWQNKEVGGKPWAMIFPRVTGASHRVEGDKEAKSARESLSLRNFTGNANGKKTPGRKGAYIEWRHRFH